MTVTAAGADGCGCGGNDHGETCYVILLACGWLSLRLDQKASIPSAVDHGAWDSSWGTHYHHGCRHCCLAQTQRLRWRWATAMVQRPLRPLPRQTHPQASRQPSLSGCAWTALAWSWWWQHACDGAWASLLASAWTSPEWIAAAHPSPRSDLASCGVLLSCLRRHRCHCRSGATVASDSSWPSFCNFCFHGRVWLENLCIWPEAVL